MSADLQKQLLKADVEQGNVGMVLEHLADTDPSPQDIKETIAAALEVRAIQKDSEALIVDASLEEGAGSFESNRAAKLRQLAQLIRNL